MDQHSSGTQAHAGISDGSCPAWTVLIADRHAKIHNQSEQALSQAIVYDLPVRVLHAFTETEAQALLRQEQDIAVVLLDVAMSSDRSDPALARFIRRELNNHTVRIILFSDDPEYTLALEHAQQYDITDCKATPEFTQDRLVASVTAAIRSFHQYFSVLLHQNGMEEIIRASTRLLGHYTIQSFVAEILNQIEGVLHRDVDGLIALSACPPCDPDTAEIIYGVGKFRDLFDTLLSDLQPDDVRARISNCIETETQLYTNDEIILTLSAESTRILLYIELGQPLQPTEQKLLDVLFTNIAVGFRNICLIQRLETQVYYDELTGLANSARLTGEIDRLLSEQIPGMLLVAIDVDSFSEINDALGYEHGNQLLQMIAQRLRTHFIGPFSLARIGGDTFGVLGPAAELQPQLLFSVLDEPFTLYDTSATVPFTLGIVQLHDFSGNGSDAVNKAVLAMKQAKLNSRLRFLYFSRNMQEAIQDRVNITRRLKPALLNNEFILLYQPQIRIDPATGHQSLIGLEALIRWQHSPDSLLSPADFIATAERTGLINEIGRWVVREAVSMAQQWQRELSAPVRVSVNVSVKQFYSPSFIPFMTHVISELDIPPSLIEIEITESLVMQDAERVIAALQSLKELGISIAIDDFGTGFSSMNYLLRLPLDRLKIDQSFITSIATSARSRSLTQFLVQLGHQLGLEIIAEGIETKDQLDIVQGFNCREFQGYYFSRPLPADKVAEYRPT